MNRSSTFFFNRKKGVARDLSRLVERDWDLTTHFESKGREAAIGTRLNVFFGALHAKIGRIVATAVDVSSTAPRLAQLARDEETDIELMTQATEEIAVAARSTTNALQGEFSRDLREVVVNSAQVAVSTGECRTDGDRAAGHMARIRTQADRLQAELRALSSQADEIGAVLALIETIAKRTNMLALNASIEAAKAGNHGSGFAVVAGEVRALAQQTTDATSRIKSTVASIQAAVTACMDEGQIVKVELEDGLEAVSRSQDKLMKVEAAMKDLDQRIGAIADVGSRIGDAADAVTQQLGPLVDAAQRVSATAGQVSLLGESLHRLSDDLVASVGTFRLGIHRRVAMEVTQLADRLSTLPCEAWEACLRGAVGAYPHMELLYVTNAIGHQITANIAATEFRTAYDGSGRARDWSTREWFKRVVADQRSYVTPIYRSAATDRFCFTASAPVIDDSGALLGVLGADIGLDTLLNDTPPVAASHGRGVHKGSPS